MVNLSIEFDLARSIYKESYYEFFKDAYAQLHPDEVYSDNWHIKFICDRLQQEFERIQKRERRKKDIIINIPFRSAKSMITTIIFPVWCWTINPKTKFICTSYSGDLALEHAGRSRDLINSYWFQTIFGDKIKLKKDANQKGFYETEQGGYRKSVGVGGQITGSGADIIVCLPKGQKITTNLGELDIKDIVENKEKVLILSYNHIKNINEFMPIVRYDKNQGKKLIKITLDSGKNIVCTEEHEIWTENRGYVMAKNILETDTLKEI